MTKVDEDTVLTLDDEEIVTRRQAIGLAALALGAATVISGPAFASDSEESDSDSESGDASSDSDGDGEEEEHEEEHNEHQEENDGDGA